MSPWWKFWNRCRHCMHQSWVDDPTCTGLPRHQRLQYACCKCSYSFYGR